MSFLVILKRFEIWLLIVVVAALFVFAFRPEESLPLSTESHPQAMALPNGDNGVATAPLPEAPEETFAVEDVTVTPTKGGLIVELTLSRRAPSGGELILDESGVTATTDDGVPVNRFFEPFREPALLLASGDSVATLKWWLERPTDVLWLDLPGQRVKAVLP